MNRNTKLRLIAEKKPFGTIGAARLLSSRADDLLVVNADNLTNLPLASLFRFRGENHGVLTLAAHKGRFCIPFGQIATKNVRLVSYLEKPNIKVTISSGANVLSRRAMECISQKRPTDMPYLVADLLQAGKM